MTAQDTVTRVPDRMEQLETVVDGDFHLTETEEDFLPYIRDPFHKELGSGVDHHTHTSLYPSLGMYNSVTRGNTESRSVRTPEDVDEGMSMLQLDRVVMTPSLNLYLQNVFHDELAAAMANAYNEWVLDTLVDPDEGRYATVLVAPQKPTEAAEEIDERADEKGIVGVMFPSGGVNPLPGDSRYFPIYEAAADNDLPIFMHAASGNTMFASPVSYQSFNRSLSIHINSHPVMHMNNIADMVTRGLSVRFPDLKFVIQEGGVGWVPFFLRRFDHEYRNARGDAPMLEKMPSEHILDQFHFTSQPLEGAPHDKEYVRKSVEFMNGAENLMFSSDYPHFDFDNSDELLRMLTGFDEEAIENIYGQTALDILKF